MSDRSGAFEDSWCAPRSELPGPAHLTIASMRRGLPRQMSCWRHDRQTPGCGHPRDAGHSRQLLRLPGRPPAAAPAPLRRSPHGLLPPEYVYDERTSMSSETVSQALARAGSAVELLRNRATRAHTFPVAPEFTNWRSEQRAWVESCALLDQSHHMTDLFLSGPDAPALLSGLAVNSFATFGPGRAKQYVAVSPDGYLIGDAILFHLDEGH